MTISFIIVDIESQNSSLRLRKCSSRHLTKIDDDLARIEGTTDVSVEKC